ncbi:50S ribosomal protein L25 [Patescibacteria group bacterium]
MELKAEKRDLHGKKTKYLRQERKLPAVIFGPGMGSISITIEYNDYIKIFKEAGETQVIDIVIGEKKYPVLIKEVHPHHITSQPIHIGFYKVDLTKKVTANVPVEIINEEENPLVKSGEYLVLTVTDEIEVEALPNDLPERFEVDALELVNPDTVITTAELKYDKSKVEIVLGEDGEEEIIARLDYAQMAEEPEEEEVTEEELMEDIEATEELSEEELEERGELEKKEGKEEKEEKEPAGNSPDQK